MNKVHKCSIPEAELNYKNDIRIVDTSLLKTDHLKSISVSDGIKLPVDQETAELVKIKLDDLEEYGYWYYINGRTYFLKERKSNFAILNELLGQELAEYMSIPTIKYNIAVDKDEIIGLFSENFLDGTFEHRKGKYASKQILKEIRNILTNPDYECDELLRRRYTSALVKSFYTAIGDRYKNSYYGIKDGKLVFTPTFDYESSFINSQSYFTGNPLFDCVFSKESVEFFKKNNPYFLEYMEMIKNSNMLSSLGNIEEKHGIVVPNCYIEYYVDFEAKRKEFIKTFGL